MFESGSTGPPVGEATPTSQFCKVLNSVLEMSSRRTPTTSCYKQHSVSHAGYNLDISTSAVQSTEVRQQWSLLFVMK